MISKYTSGSRIHQALERINRSSVTAQELRKEINYTESILRLEEFIINPLLADGYITRGETNNFFALLIVTPKGEEKYRDMGVVKKHMPKVEKLDRFVGTYEGKELKAFTGRPGAMDHEKCPSLMADGLVYRRVR